MAKTLKIIVNPDPILRRQSRPVSKNELDSPEFASLLLDMEKTMKEKDGAGLAAPQIGNNIRVAVIQKDETTVFMINPRLAKKSWAKEKADEGCLSVLSETGEILYGPVSRHKKVTCVYLDEKGQQKKISAEGILARAIQHELDHLDGILFIDRLEPGAKLSVLLDGAK